MAKYNLAGCFASASGSLLTGVAMYVAESHLPSLRVHQLVLSVYALVHLLLMGLFTRLSKDIEVSSPSIASKQANPVSLFLGLHKSKMLVLKLSMLFAIDSFAGSFVLMSLIIEWFSFTYGTRPHQLGLIVFICNIVAGCSALLAAKLAAKIGLINTMVATHVPSNVMLILVPLMPTEASAVAMLCARFCISQMDVPTRNAYVAGVVDEDERSGANGVLNVVRSVGASLGPLCTGLLFESGGKSSAYPFFIAGGLKIVYDFAVRNGVEPHTSKDSIHK